MPRVADIYSRPAGIDAVPNATIESVDYNANVADVEADLNYPRPIVAGGTGSSTAAGALTNLGAVAKAGDTMTGNLTINKADPALILRKTAANQQTQIISYLNATPRWLLSLANSTAESGGNVGSDCTLYRYNDDGSLIGIALEINRQSGLATIGGNVTISKADPYLYLNKAAAGQTSAILGQKAGVTRWSMALGETSAESGSNAGSDFSVSRYADNGTFLGTAMSINRANGALQMNGNTTVNGGYLVVTGSTPAQGNLYFGNTGTKYLGYDGANYSLVGGGLYTAAITSSAGITANNFFSCQSANPILWMRDAGGTTKGYFLWEPANNEVYFYNAVAGYGVTVEAGGGVKVGTGMRCRPGAAGAYGGNIHNIGFSGSAHMWIDLTDNGQIAYTSDYRIKKDVADLPATWDVVKALRPIKYTQAEYTPTIEKERKLKEAKDRAEQGIKDDKLAVEPMYAADDIERWGFIAHELQETLIESAASAYKDAPDAVQSPNPWTVIAALTKALQEAMTRIEALEATVQVTPT